MTLPRLLLLTDRSQLPPGASLPDHVAACVTAGATHVVLRELDLSPSHRAGLVESLNGTGAVVLSAREPVIGAAGVHQASSARGPVRGLVGRSCHSVDEVALAAADGCTYVTLGPFALTRSKPGYGPVVEPAIYAGPPLPTYALGGITAANATAAIAAGAHGIAVMGEVMRSSTPGAVVRELIEVLG